MWALMPTVAPPVRLSAVVMTHPARMRYAHQLRERHLELDLQVVVDPAPDEDGGALRTARLAWAAVAPGATHHLVVQDDTVLCPRFWDHLERAILARPDQALSLYTEWGSQTSYAVRLAALSGSAWAEVIEQYVPTQALVLPADVARAFGRYAGYSGPHDDFAMRLFLASAGVPTLVTVPNLAEDARLPSVVGHDYLGERASVCFLAEGMGNVGWSTETAVPTVVPVFGFTVGQPYSVVRADRPGGRWRRVSPPAVPRSGPTAAALDIGRVEVQRCPAALRSVGPRLLLGVWLTAYGLGMVAADLLGPDRAGPAELDRALARPTVRRALATMPHGALRFLVDDYLLAEHSDHLSRLVELGVRQGYEARLGTEPSRSRPPSTGDTGG
jgi:hypothetical protein